MKFLHKILDTLLSKNKDLSQFTLVLPGKRPIVFIKQILKEKKYNGFLPQFSTIEDTITHIADLQPISGVALWLFAYQIYKNLPLHQHEDFEGFLKWFPVLIKDWNDILKFTENDEAVLRYMFDEERIKNWAENLDPNDDKPRKKYLNFWKNMTVFLPILKQKLLEQNKATDGMIHQIAQQKIPQFAIDNKDFMVFCGFNALTPVEELLIKNLLQWDKALCFQLADSYYFNDKKQEAGQFLRKQKEWKEFNKSRPFLWIENQFSEPKKIKAYEISGNITQTKILPKIFEEIEDENYKNTAVILLDENLLPATLESLKMIRKINITMGYPLKNLSFSSAIRAVFYLQKQIENKKTAFYYKDVLAIIEQIPTAPEEQKLIENLKKEIKNKNKIYLTSDWILQQIGSCVFAHVFLPFKDAAAFLDSLISLCMSFKWYDIEDILYENIAAFEEVFRIIKNQIAEYDFENNVETLEVLINQYIQSENIDFRGEPLDGLQVMGLLETRLLNFENVILLSVNEGKLPLGNSQNTYLPFDVRKQFGMHTFLENDSIYAYHFYRLLQDCKQVHLLYNEQSSGTNTGEKSRFIKQIEIESPHEVEHIIIENKTTNVEDIELVYKKTPIVLEQLEEWKKRVSYSHLSSYLYNPAQFYYQKILNIKEEKEVEEELSNRDFGSLIHAVLDMVYTPFIGNFLEKQKLVDVLNSLDEAINLSIKKMGYDSEYYEKGINYIHKLVAKKTIKEIIEYDLELVENNNQLKILDLEKKFDSIPFPINEEQTDHVYLYGFIDRIDELNGTLRIIDYKTGTVKINAKPNRKPNENIDFCTHTENKIATQLYLYQYVVERLPEYLHKPKALYVWKLLNPKEGLVYFEPSTNYNEYETALESMKNLILEILDPTLDFVHKEQKKDG